MNTILLLSIARYLFSGLRNGFIYKGNPTAALLASIATLACTFGAGYFCIIGMGWGIRQSTISVFIDVAQISCVAASAIASVLVMVRSKNRFINDLHLKTTLESMFYTGLCLVSGFWPLVACMLAVYPGVVFQKIAINELSGLNTLDEQTDDPTGETYGIPSLGIKIPRQSFTTRIILAIISLVIIIFLNF
jgi:hypothetical protein